MEGLRKRPLPFVPSPIDVVYKMLSIADPNPDEVLVDLGSGDGRIILSAARYYKCRSIGVEKNTNLVDLTRRKINTMDLDNVTVVHGDLYNFDFSKADVVTLYLLPETLHILLPKFKELKRGARIISHDYHIPYLTPYEVHEVKSSETNRTHKIYLYLMK
ncbi:MAG: class I SAM-dependent methyltransferase [Aigarchaeota archaeon]|nr:class I SAM-dependent methyltransferase [Aigarchaeota archaeon]MCX8192858.1 class I SAM-dependent methyltransferase [Nitrososphaeria archaeon]MDW7986586.1 class I SAM-dependent methyltransferase [Nitrososphaerota archaeon]